MKRVFITTLLIGFLSQTGIGQNFDKEKLDNYFKALETNHKFNGSVAVSKDGAIIYSKAIGYLDMENQVKTNENSKYRIGSISKIFTSVLVLKAVEEKKLNLNQTIEPFFPTIKNADKITIKHLLGHRSGISNFTDNEDYGSWYTQPKTENDLIEIISKGGSVFSPNSKAEYSNSNYVLLSFILEKTYNKAYADILEDYIIQPVGLINTCYGGKIIPANNECKSYSYQNNWRVEPETDMSIPLGAGGIVSTPGDLVKFSHALFGGMLLKAESLDLMKTINDQYGLGLFQIPFYDKTAYGHTGGIDGFSSVLSFFPDENISYALTSNGTNYNNNDISVAVLSAVFNKPFDIPEFTTHTPAPEELEQYLGVYASKDMSLKITFTRDGNKLIAQATGQDSFALEATAKDKFKFDPAGIALEFNPTDKTMILKQGGGQFNFSKE